MKKILYLLLGALLLSCLLVSCTGGNEAVSEDTHKHSFDTAWSFDANGHWYAANCGHDMKANTAAHSDEDKDGACDVCGYDGDHEHVYAEEWAHDEANHWHAATCGHAVKSEEAPHADANNDSLCDGCAWDYDHTHTYEDAWSHDADNHWYAVSCGHDVEVKGKAAHTDENNDGICDGCQWNYDHDHTYAEEWSHDTENHWHDTTCGHSVTKDVAAHTDENNDGICEGCAWDYDHTHTYASEEWTINDTHHWHAPTCGHDVEGIDSAEHVDSDNNRECDVCAYNYDHEHTYNREVWAYDKTSHYHAADCGHAVRADEEAHKDTDNEGHCDVCGWDYGHTHEFKTEWSHNATNHWHDTSCGHSVKSDEAAHADANNDGICDGCAWNYDHTHTYDTSKWTIGANEHFHAPTCGHDSLYVRQDEEAHVDKNRDDKCDVCGGYASFETVVENATAPETAGKVSSGTIHIKSNTEYSVYQGHVKYEFGDGYLHMVDEQSYGGMNRHFEYWFGTYGSNSIFAISQEGGDPFRDMGADATFMDGYYFSGDFISYAFTSRGVESLVYNLYNIRNGDNGAGVSAWREHYDQASDTYSFMYTYNGSDVTVSFKINADFVMESVSITTTATPATGSTEPGGHFITISQKVGERSAVNPYDPDVLLINAFTVKDPNGKVLKDGDTIEILAGSDNLIYLTISELLPTTANATYDKIVASFDDKALQSYVNNTDKTVIVNGRTEGTYDLTLASDHVSMTLKVKITYPAPTSIHPVVYNADGSYGSKSTVTVYLGDVLNFKAGVNEAADSRYTVQITRGDATGATITEGVVEVLGSEIPVSVFTPTKTGRYIVVITSVSNPSLSATLDITVTERPKIENILVGQYQASFYGSIMYDVTFTPESEGATKGTVVIVDGTASSGGYNQETKTATYQYEYLSDGIQLTLLEGDELNIKIVLTETLGLKIGNFTLTKVS